MAWWGGFSTPIDVLQTAPQYVLQGCGEVTSMGSLSHLDRYLKRRGYSWVYCRRVPTPLLELDSRGPVVRQALGTRDLVIARKARDLLAAADDELWASMTLGENVGRSKDRYTAALLRVKAMGFSYISADELANSASWQELSSRLEAILPASTPLEVEQAVLGLVDEPKDNFDDALTLYIEGPGHINLQNKSADQLRKWKNIPLRAIARFKEVVGDKPLADITRADAVQFYRYWLGRVAPEADDVEPMHPSSANREIGELRKLYREYFDFKHNDKHRLNPFLQLSFSEDGSDPRPPFPAEWMAEKFLKAGPLAGLNEEARGVLLAMIETGCRPSEICNLTPNAIILDHDVPHIEIKPRRAIDRKNEDVREFGPRQLKSAASNRQLPLVGISLAVFKKFPGGFPRYMDKAGTVCQTINMYLAENALLPTEAHTLYCVRHAFEDRMTRADIDFEVRTRMLGHTIARPKYGEAGGLAWQRDLLIRMALPFDADIT